MTKNKRADLGGIGSTEKRLTTKSKGFFIPNCNPFPHSHQCKYCGSDYMRSRSIAIASDADNGPTLLSASDLKWGAHSAGEDGYDDASGGRNNI